MLQRRNVHSCSIGLLYIGAVVVAECAAALCARVLLGREPVVLVNVAAAESQVGQWERGTGELTSLPTGSRAYGRAGQRTQIRLEIRWEGSHQTSSTSAPA